MWMRHVRYSPFSSFAELMADEWNVTSSNAPSQFSWFFTGLRYDCCRSQLLVVRIPGHSVDHLPCDDPPFRAQPRRLVSGDYCCRRHPRKNLDYIDSLDTEGISWAEYHAGMPYVGCQGFNYSNTPTLWPPWRSSQRQTWR